jgi:hypothetical protein
MVAVLPEAGSKVRPADAERVLKLDPLVPPCTLRVCVRAPHTDAGGSFSTTWSTATLLPRSICTHCGKALDGLSQ